MEHFSLALIFEIEVRYGSVVTRATERPVGVLMQLSGGASAL
jgi:hypothetical protein